MRLSIENISRILAGVALTGALYGCGGASSNDQGVSFTLLGFFEDVGDAGSDELPVGVVGVTFPISGSASNSNPDEDDTTLGGAVRVAIGVQNNLGCQGLRTDRAYISYHVTGAETQPPSTSQPVAILMGPADSEGVESCSSTLPPSFSTLANRSFALVRVVPPEIREWIALNRNSLPQPPFNLQISVEVSGVTTAGDSLVSNQATLLASVVPDVVIKPTAGGNDDTVVE